MASHHLPSYAAAFSGRLRVRGAREQSDAEQNHLSRLGAGITMADGSGPVARIECVGCSASICSRALIEGRANGKALVKTRLDSIAAIKETSADDAPFVLKDGTERRLSLVTGSRVLYLASPPKPGLRVNAHR
jgi:hypothetical protein